MKRVIVGFLLICSIIALGIWIYTHLPKPEIPHISSHVNLKFTIIKDDTCMIGKYPCWKVVQHLPETSLERSPNNVPGKSVRKNLTLEEMGLTVTSVDYAYDGGSEMYTLSNNVTVFAHWNTNRSNPGFDFITITWPDGTQKKFNPQGNSVQ